MPSLAMRNRKKPGTAAAPLASLRPILKWAGGKSGLAHEISAATPAKFNRYFEPFLGGAAVFLANTPPLAFLSDSNEDLINCYRVVRDKPSRLMRVIDSLPLGETAFYEIRSWDVESLDAVTAAARLIYLNKTCFNGLFRVNKRGRFNTPYGKRTDVTLIEPVNFRKVSAALRNVELECSDFRLAYAGLHSEGDFVYLDPPYVPAGKHSDFKRYTKTQFHEKDQVELAEHFMELSRRGCHVLLSNSHQPIVARLYKGYFAKVVLAPRAISCKASGRSAAQELLIANYSFPGADRL